MAPPRAHSSPLTRGSLAALGLAALLVSTWATPPPTLAPERDASPPAAAPPAGPALASVEAGPPSPPPLTAPLPPLPRLALWVPAEGTRRVLDDASRVDALLEDARALGASDLFVQVYRGGRAWFDSSIADAEPWQAARGRSGGEDPLARLLAGARRDGVRVHAWVNALSLAGHRDGAMVRRLGRGAVHVDRRGRSVLDYPPDLDLPEPDRRWYRMGTPQVWLDPAVPAVGETLAATVRELLARYPALDGIHLDYIRHPDVLPFVPGSRFDVGMDFGYGAAARARFERETGLRAPFGGEAGSPERWDAWRRDRVTDVVRAVVAAARAEKPGVEASAAVWAFADRAYLSLLQDWRGWLDEGLLDFAVPMAYTRDDRLLRQLAASALGGVGGERAWVGLGAWLFAREPARAAAQLEMARGLRPRGISLFSYDAIVDAPELRASLAPDRTPRGAGGG